MEHEPITSADSFAALARKTRVSEWPPTLQVDPSIWHEVLDRYPDLSRFVVEHKPLPNDVLERLSRWPNLSIRYQLWMHDRLPHGVVETLLRDINPGVRQGAGKWRGITLEQLAAAHPGHPSWPVSDAVARSLKERFAVHWRDIASQASSPRLKPYDDPKEMAALLATEGYPQLDPLNVEANSDWMDAICGSLEVANWVSYSRQASEPVLRQIAAHGCRRCRSAVAASPNSPPQVLANLSLDPSSVVRHGVVENNRTDLPSLLLLASDDTFVVRRIAQALLEQRYGVVFASQHVLAAPQSEHLEPIATVGEFLNLCLSVNPEDRIRVRFGKLNRRVWMSMRCRTRYPSVLASNPTVPDEFVLEMDRDHVAAQRARLGPGYWHIEGLALLGRPSLAEQLARHPSPPLRSMVAGSPNVPVRTLEYLAADSIESIAVSAKQTLHTLSGGTKRELVCLGRFGSPDEILSTITDPDPGKRRHYSRRIAPQRMWREVLERAPELAKWVAINETVGPRLLDELADWPDPEVRRWVCDHPRIWLKTLDRLAFEADSSVRRRAVYNSRLSDEQFRRLRHDSDSEVAAEAARRLAAREYANRLLNDPEWWRHLGNSEIG